jgi:hypothetical protein
MFDWGCKSCGYGGEQTADHCHNCGWIGDLEGEGSPCPNCGGEMSDYYACPVCDATEEYGFDVNPNGLDWVVCGGESGPKARPMHPDWARSQRDQCAAAGTAFFFKQWGEWHPDKMFDHVGTRGIIMRADGTMPTDDMIEPIARGEFDFTGWHHFAAVGKRRAGRLLDGVEHNGFPPAHGPGHAEVRT